MSRYILVHMVGKCNGICTVDTETRSRSYGRILCAPNKVHRNSRGKTFVTPDPNKPPAGVGYLVRVYPK